MQPRGRILIVDDEANARSALAELLRDEGYQVESAADGFKALAKVEEFAPDLLLTDLNMPGVDGIELMRKSQAIDAEIACVVMTAFGSVDSAVAAMRQGAADYVGKPINIDELLIILDHALERRRLRAEAGQLRSRLRERHRVANLVGTSPAIQAVIDVVMQVAPSRASVLITGESGTGKELIAAALHEHSPRVKGPLVKLHCAALAETLLESELFGHERGAFTGAVARRDGLLQQADGGSLFLDEIGEISQATQVKLLRFLQSHELQRVGGNQTIKVDVRIIAATNRDLVQRVKEGIFREDLFYRLNVVSIEMPALRARPSDIPLLAAHFLARFGAENGKDIPGFSDDALQRLVRHTWPGNVRELENAVERAVVVARGELIQVQDLGASIGQSPTEEPTRPKVPGATMAEIERHAILTTLEQTGGSTSRAAEILGISARTIQYRLHEYQEEAHPSSPPAKAKDKP